MNKILVPAALALSFVAGGLSAATLTGDTVEFVAIADGFVVQTDTYLVGAGYEGTVGDHQIDLNMNTGSEANGFEMTLIPGSYCGYYNCDGTDVSLIFYDLDFSDGEELIGFDLTPGAINPIVTILGPDAISFTFVDTDYTSRGLFFSGEFITAVAAVPLPAAAWMLVAGLGGLGFAGRRRKTS